MLAASLSATGPVSHRSTAWLWNLTDSAEAIEVSVRYPRQVRLRSPAVVHRIRDLSDAHVLRRNGLPLTSPMRTIVDLGEGASASIVEELLPSSNAGDRTAMQALSFQPGAHA